MARVGPLPLRRRAGWSLLVASAAPLLAACGGAAGSSNSGGLAVVAAESFWGSLAAQLGGDRVTVTSVIANPNADPHTYEPTAQDGRLVAQASYVIANGAGYDAWVQRLTEANPSPGRRELDVAELAGRRPGDNPHVWYSPPVVEQAVERIGRDLSRLDPAGAGTYARRAAALRRSGLGRYDGLRRSIRDRFSGVAVGATESIFVDLAADLGLRLLTPPGYLRAISEGEDPSPADRSTAGGQITGRQVSVLVFNRQNSSPDVQVLVESARARSIPVVPITETLDPPSASFQDWQADQLAALSGALARATGR